MNRPKYLRARLLLAFASLFVAVRAEAAKIVIVRPAAASRQVKETLSRLHGEVLSLGLEVAIAERPATDARAWMERMAQAPDTDAVIEVIGDGAPSVEIWVFERGTRRAAVSRVALEPGADNAPARLAIRAVEALRSSLVEIDLAANGQPRAATAAGEPPATLTQGRPERAGPREDFDLQAGTVLLTSLDGVGPALMPVVDVAWSGRTFMPSWLALQGTLAGFGSRPAIETAAGTARVAQQYAVVGVRSCVGARAIQPYIALSAGVLRTAIEGQADTAGDAHSVERWSFLLDGSVGARLRVTGRYHLTLAAHVQLAEPYIAIHFVDALVATSGRPNVLVSLTVGAWL
jgi:hypothetical protein